MFGLLIFRGQDLVEKDRFSFPVFLGNEDHRDKLGHIAYMLYIHNIHPYTKVSRFPASFTCRKLPFCSYKKPFCHWKSCEDLLRLAELFAEPAKASGQRSPLAVYRVCDRDPLPRGGAILPLPRHFFFTKMPTFSLEDKTFGIQTTRMSGSWIPYLQQNLTTICYNIDFWWPPRLMNQVVRPYFMPWKFQRVLRFFKSNGATMQKHATFIFLCTPFFKQPNTCIPIKGANSTSICISCWEKPAELTRGLWVTHSSSMQLQMQWTCGTKSLFPWQRWQSCVPGTTWYLGYGANEGFFRGTLSLLQAGFCLPRYQAYNAGYPLPEFAESFPEDVLHPIVRQHPITGEEMVRKLNSTKHNVLRFLLFCCWGMRVSSINIVVLIRCRVCVTRMRGCFRMRV